jgi:hypothetical protein
MLTAVTWQQITRSRAACTSLIPGYLRLYCAGAAATHPDLYAILGITPQCTQEDIKRAFLDVRLPNWLL